MENFNIFKYKKVGNSEKKTRYRFENEEQKMNIFDFGAIKSKLVCRQVQNIAFTYFLGHFKCLRIRPVNLYKS